MAHGQNSYAMQLVELLISIWTQNWDPYLQNSVGDPTICFLILYCIQSDDSWAQPKKITPVIARIIYIIRAIFLYHVHFNDRNANIRERFTEVKECILEDNDSIFQSLYSIQHYASSIALSETALPCLYWVDKHHNEFKWKGSKEITIHQFRRFGQDLI